MDHVEGPQRMLLGLHHGNMMFEESMAVSLIALAPGFVLDPPFFLWVLTQYSVDHETITHLLSCRHRVGFFHLFKFLGVLMPARSSVK